MKKLTFSIILIILCSLTQNCKNRKEEFIHLSQTKIDANHFSVFVYSKTVSDSTILYTDTIVGELHSGTEFQTEWFDGSVNCIVPNYIPENTYRTHTNLKVILKHKP